MATFTFNAIASHGYRGDNGAQTSTSRLFAGPLSGNGANAPNTGTNELALVVFDANDIRTKLTGQTITGCHLSFYVPSEASGGDTVFMGTHNYTALPATVSTQNTNSVDYTSFTFYGSWVTTAYPELCSNTTNNYATYTFTLPASGGNVTLRSVMSPNSGYAAISVDGGSETNVSLYRTSVATNVSVWTSNNLSAGQHTLKVRVSGMKQGAANNDIVSVAGADVYQFSDPRQNQDRIEYRAVSTGAVSGLDLGTTIGAEFRDGVSTGIVFGPSTYNAYPTDWVEISPYNDATTARRPQLVIDTTTTNLAPNAPTLNSPPANTVLDATNNSLGFSWTHSDPNGDPQAGWVFRRNKGGGTYDYWNGTAFTSTSTVLTTATAPLTNGVMTIPAGKWSNGQAYSWSVATRDPAGLQGSFAPDRVLYTSTPPTTTVQGPSGTIAAPRPSISWTFGDPDGQTQYGWAAQIVPSDVYTNPGFNPDNYLGAAWSGSDTTTATSTVPTTDLVNHKTYQAYVKVASSPNPSGGLQWSPWSSTTFQVVIPPSAPTMSYPTNGSIVDLRAGFTMTWKNNFFSNVGSQTAFALRRIVAGGSYQWWNGATWQATETFLNGSAASYAFRANEVLNGSTYTFAVAIRDDYNQVSPYSSGTTVTGNTVPSVNVITPLGVTVTTRPPITWTMYDPENDAQQSYQVRIISVDVYGGADPVTFNAGTATAVWDSGEITASAATVRNVVPGVDLQNATTYRAYVRSKAGGLYSSWTYSEFVVSLVPPAGPAVTTQVVDDSGVINVIVQARDSMLTDPISRNVSGWNGRANCTVASNIYFPSGKAKLASDATATAVGTMSVTTASASPVAAGFLYTGGVSVLAPVGTPAVTCYVFIEWLNSSGQVLSSSFGSPAIDTAAIRTTVTDVAPDNAVTARLSIQFSNVPTVGHKHRFFDPVLRPGNGAEWSLGGLLGNTSVTVREVTDDRVLRLGRDVPLPANTQQVTIVDEEAAIGRPQVYGALTRAVYPNAVLISAESRIDPVSWSSGWLWISDPLRVGSGRLFQPIQFHAITRPVRQGKFRPLGRADAVFTTGVRGMREGSFQIICHTRADREAFQDLVDNSDVLLIRHPPDQGDTEGDAIYVMFEGDAPVDRPLSSRTPHRTIEQSWTEQKRPLILIDYNS